MEVFCANSSSRTLVTESRACCRLRSVILRMTACTPVSPLYRMDPTDAHINRPAVRRNALNSVRATFFLPRKPASRNALARRRESGCMKSPIFRPTSSLAERSPPAPHRRIRKGDFVADHHQDRIRRQLNQGAVAGLTSSRACSERLRAVTSSREKTSSSTWPPHPESAPASSPNRLYPFGMVGKENGLAEAS